MVTGAHWLSIWDAIDLVMERDQLSIGAAQATLCEAGASGMVRTMHGRTPLEAALWRHGVMDLDEGELIVHGGMLRYRPQVSAEDLAYWLANRAKATTAPRKARRTSGPKPVKARDDAVAFRLAAGERPALNVVWKAFCHSVRIDCNAKASDRGFSDRAIRREVERRLTQTRV